MFDSETLLRDFDGQPPYKFCGGSSYITATNLATTNEASIVRGWPMGKAVRVARMKRGWRAFEKRADSNGIPDQDDAIRIHKAMFPGLPEPRPIATQDRALVRNHLEQGGALSMAFRLSALPVRSRWRQYTSADHQATIWDLDHGRVTRQDPMHPHSNTYRGEKLSLDEGLDAAEAIENGTILYWLYPIGGWTQQRLRTTEFREEIADLKIKVVNLKIALGNRPPANEQLVAENKLLKQRIGTAVAELQTLDNSLERVVAALVHP